MAGNNSIQLLRGGGHFSSEVLLPGQPYYDYDGNKLYIGGENDTAINQAVPINNSISTYWKSMHYDNNAIRITAGDRAFIELKTGDILPALCVDAPNNSTGTTWQIPWFEKRRIAPTTSMGNLTWADTELCKWLDDDALDLFPDYMINLMTYNYHSDHRSQLWIPSAEEIWGQEASFPSTMVKDVASSQFGYYEQLLAGDNISPQTKNPKLSGNINVWIRNGSTNSGQGWYFLDKSGYLPSTLPLSSTMGLIICFNIT